MTPEELKEFTDKFGAEAAKEIKKHTDQIKVDMDAKYEEFKKGTITTEEFEKYKKEVVEPLNDLLKQMEDASKEQGKELAKLMENPRVTKKMGFVDFLSTKLCDPKDPTKFNMDLRNGPVLEITADEMKAAGVLSIANAVSALENGPSNPWLPGLDGGTGLEIFEIMQNPNFLINRVDLGRTNQSYLAWINELVIEGAPSTDVAEGTSKPQIQPSWEVAFSKAKKAAAWVEVTEELADDLPQLLTRTRRIIEEEVIRSFDNQIQTDVIAKAHPFEITSMDDMVELANRYDAERALMAQIGTYNFTANTNAINPVTSALMDTSKNTNGTYLLPPFLQRLQAMTVEANKVAVDYALIGDLKQYKVDIYKPFTLRVGLINDDLIKNKFVILGEMRYHSYISDNRTKAIAYDNLTDVAAQINKAA